MELQNIKTKKCPICGCSEIISESVEVSTFDRKIKVHCNGTRWEHRKFLCGKEICYEPNFQREALRGECANDKKYIEMLQKRENDKSKLVSFCEEQKIDESIIRQLKTYVL